MFNTPIKPMLLHKSDTVPEGEYIHQLTSDGFRCLLHWGIEGVRLFTRHQNECTRQFPEMKAINLLAENVVLDGEMIVLDEDNKPCFESVIARFLTKDELSIRRGLRTQPAHFVAYDILYLNGQDVTKLPLQDRLSLLYEVVELIPQISACERFDDGEGLFRSVVDMGLEGIVSKRKYSIYRLDTRSEDWLKIKTTNTKSSESQAFARMSLHGRFLKMDTM